MKAFLYWDKLRLENTLSLIYPGYIPQKKDVRDIATMTRILYSNFTDCFFSLSTFMIFWVCNIMENGATCNSFQFALDTIDIFLFVQIFRSIFLPCCPSTVNRRYFFKIDRRNIIFYGKVSNICMVMSQIFPEPFRSIPATLSWFSLFHFKRLLWSGVL